MSIFDVGPWANLLPRQRTPAVGRIHHGSRAFIADSRALAREPKPRPAHARNAIHASGCERGNPAGAIAQKLVCLIRCLTLAKPAESVIHADQDSGRFRMGVEVTNTIKTVRVEYSMIVRAEVHIVAFQERRPAPHEHPFNATTGRPTCSGPGDAANIKTINGDVCTVLSPGHAALTVDHPAGAGELSPRIADTARQGAEPIIVEVNRGCISQSIDESFIPIQGCPIKHIAEANDPSAGELIIAANLTAAGKATVVCRDLSKTGNIRPGAAKYPTDV